jgi:ribosomal protein S12 methylthiotransferase
MQSKKNRPVRVGLISLGCAKNLADAEIMLGTLLKDGMEVTNDPRRADVLIVNTCSFIDSAQEESVDAILQSDELRESRQPHQGLVVSGCLPQRFRDELPGLLPEVDAFMGIDQTTKVTEIVNLALARRHEKLQHRRSCNGQSGVSRITGQSPSLVAKTDPAQITQANLPAVLDVTPRPTYIPDYATPRFRLTPRHFAYLKIAEGCNHPCSFCIIPRMRGSHRSRQQEDVVAEARALISDGVKELNLISQDSTYYGLDLSPNHSRAIARPERFTAAVKGLPTDATTICTLLRALNDLPGDFWIRLLYTHPAHWTDELIATIAQCPKVARYVDIPLQHIHENMLERMRRETSQKYIVDLLRRIRAGIPGIILRTTLIVGFPGETEAYFEALLDFIRQTRFERLGVFTYSQQAGTRAGQMAGQVAEPVKRARRDRAMAAQHEIAVAVAESFVGRRLKVLVENQASAKQLRQARIQSWEHGLIRGSDEQAIRLKGNYLVARGDGDAPDIDGRVYVQMPRSGQPGGLRIGDFAQVRIIGHTDYDLIGEPA